MPFDSYSPLTPAYRGKATGGFQLLPDNSYYGCCACIGAAGVGVFLENAVTQEGDTVTVSFYERGTVSLRVCDTDVTLRLMTDYPTDGSIKIEVEAASPVTFTLRLRTPAWAGEGGYKTYTREWHRDTLTLDLPMALRVLRPLTWEKDTLYNQVNWQSPGKFAEVSAVEVEHLPEEDKYFAVLRGPLTMAIDSRMGKAADGTFPLPVSAEVKKPEIVPGVPCLLRLTAVAANGESYDLVDYGSAGRDWKTMIAAWVPTEE